MHGNSNKMQKEIGKYRFKYESENEDENVDENVGYQSVVSSAS